jgi:hypothetical protein
MGTEIIINRGPLAGFLESDIDYRECANVEFH